MLSYFPTPYPDELWLSVLWRMLIRMGDNRPISGSGITSSCIAIARTVYELPAGILNPEEIVMEHTLFPYINRMRPLKEKKAALSDLCRNVAAGSENSSRPPLTLRYCPCCVKEDIETYGESYWHREHQLPFMPACRKHKVMLMRYNDCTARAKGRPKLPEWITGVTDNDAPITEKEETLADTLYAYLTLPLEYGPEKDSNPLFHSLEFHYGMMKDQRHLSAAGRAIYRDLISAFGEDMTRSLFGRQMSSTELMKIKQWRFRTPERYAVLSVLVGQEPETTFTVQKEETEKDEAKVKAIRRAG